MSDLPPLSKEMEDKVEEWVAAKRQRDFETSDRIRDELKDQGVNPEDYRPPPGRGGGGGGYGGGGYGGGGGGYGGGGGGGLPPLSKEMEDKVEEWVAAKRQRDFETSDRIRDELRQQGISPEEYRPPPGPPRGGGGGGYGGIQSTSDGTSSSSTASSYRLEMRHTHTHANREIQQSYHSHPSKPKHAIISSITTVQTHLRHNNITHTVDKQPRTQQQPHMHSSAAATHAARPEP
jgi:hypothetical protein